MIYVHLRSFTANSLAALLVCAALQTTAQSQKAAAPSGKRPGAAGVPASVHQVTAVAFSPDSTKVAAGGYQVVTIFDASSGRALARLTGHPGAITSLQFSPDGRWLAVAGGLPGRKGEVRVWDVSWVKTKGLWAVKTSPLVLEGPSDVVYGVAFSPNGRRLAAASYDHDVTLWDLPIAVASPKSKIQNPKSKILRDHTDAVYAVAFSPDGRLLASAAGDRTVKVWNAATGKRLYTLSESTAELYAVAFRPGGKQIAAGGADKTLRTWDITPTGGTLAKSAFAHEGAILRVVYARDGQTLVTSGEDDAVKRWDAVTLAERKVYPKQPDWPQGIAISPDGRLVAVGCHNGALALYDASTGRLLRTPLRGTPLEAGSEMSPPRTSRIPGRTPGDQRQRGPIGKGGATLQQASLGDISPHGAPRGQTVRFTLTGGLLNDAMGVYFDDPAITGKIVTPPDKNAGTLHVDAALGPTARIGVHRVFVQTPHGTTGSVPFAVGDWPEIGQAEPNNTPDTAQKIAPPCTVIGLMDTPGDVDCYRFEARAGEELVFEVVAQPLRSRLQPVLTLMDGTGKVLAESKPQVRRPDALLGYHFDAPGSYVIALRDYESASGGDTHYRLNVGEFPVVTDVFPLGAQRGTTVEVQVRGFNLGGATTTRVQVPADAGWGRSVEASLQTPRGPLHVTRRLSVGEDPEVMQEPGSESPEKAQRVPVPVAVNSRLRTNDQRPTTSDEIQNPKSKIQNAGHYYRFAAKKGETLLIDVMARRLGSPLDSEIEVLDAQGQPIERAVLRAVSQTEVTLSDRDSASSGIRLLALPGLNVDDYVMVGREVIRVFDLPIGPDADVGFRSYQGQRLGYFGTTPEYHSVGAAVYKVEVHPPGSTFSPNGYPLTHLFYRNDDGGPLYGKDSHLEFTAPRDGDYLVRLSDARGQQGEDYAYRLLIHPPRPDFRITMSPEHPNLPKGGAVTVAVECERYDGFDGPVNVRMEGLPAGFTATSSVIEAGQDATTLLISAAPDARTPPPAGAIRVVGRARVGGREVAHTIEPDNGVRLLTVLPDPDIRVATDRREVVLRPGQEAVVEAQVDRQGKFGARVPIEVRNLPFGVRVEDVGLNGILVTEQQTSRTFTLYCEPWVKPQTRPFYVIGVVEGGTANAAPPLTLRIEPASPSRAASRAPEKHASNRRAAEARR